MAPEINDRESLWRGGFWLGLAWGSLEVGLSRWMAPLPHLPALAEIILSVVFWTVFALALSLALRPWGARGAAAGPLLLIGLFFVVTTNLLVHPFLFSGVWMLSPKGLLYTLWFAVLLMAPALIALLRSRGRPFTLSPRAAVVTAVLMGVAFAVGRSRLTWWPIGMTRVYTAIALAGLMQAGALFLVLRTWRLSAWSRRALTAALLAALLCPIPWALRDRPASPRMSTAPPDAPPVIIISLDTTRPDHLSYFGYDRPTSPNLDRFLASCRVFPVAYATSPWTPPSHASVFTGLHPRTHGVHHLPASPGYKLPPALDPRAGTLAEHFREQGYVTTAIAANRLAVSPELHLDRGFQEVRTGFRLPDQPVPLNFLRGATRVLRNRWLWRFAGLHYDAVDITKQVVTWLDRNQERPFFLFVNYLDPHRPYAPPIASLPDYERMSTRDRLTWSWERVPSGDHRFDAYDGELRHMDAALGTLFTELATRAILDRAIVVVFTDHGEFFGEMGLTGHGREVHEAVLRALLAFRLPRGAHAGVDSTLVTLADVPSLLMDCLQERVPVPPERSGPQVLGEAYLTRRHMRSAPRLAGSSRLVAVRQGNYKLLDGGEAYSLYELAADPGEALDLAGEHPETARRLHDFLSAWDDQVGLADHNQDDEQADRLRETLRGLGYFQ